MSREEARLRTWKRLYMLAAKEADQGNRDRSLQMLHRCLKLSMGPPVIGEAAVRSLRALSKEYARSKDFSRQFKAQKRLLDVQNSVGVELIEPRALLESMLANARQRSSDADVREVLSQLVDLEGEGQEKDPKVLEGWLNQLLSGPGSQPKDRVAWAERLLSLAQGPLAKGPLEVIEARIRLGEIQYGADQEFLAELTFSECTYDLLSHAEKQPAKVAELWRELGELAKKREDTQAANLLETMAKALEGGDSERHATGEALYQEGFRYFQIGRLKLSGDPLVAALHPLWKRTLPESEVTAHQVLVLLSGLAAVEDHREVVRICEKAAPLFPVALGKDNALTAKLHFSWGSALQAMKQDLDSVRPFAEAARILEISSQGRAAEIIQARNYQASALDKAGMVEEARGAYQALLTILRKKYGEGRIQLVHSLQRLGLLSWEAGDLALAESSLLEAYEIQEANKSYGREAKAETNVALATIFARQGRMDEARTHIRRANYYGATVEQLQEARGKTGSY